MSQCCSRAGGVRRRQRSSAVDELVGHRNMRWVGIDTNDPSVGRDPFGEQLDDAAGSAAHVDGGVAIMEADPIQQPRTVGRELVGLTLQTSAFRVAAAQGVHRVGITGTVALGRQSARGRNHSSPRRLTVSESAMAQLLASAGPTISVIERRLRSGQPLGHRGQVPLIHPPGLDTTLP